MTEAKCGPEVEAFINAIGGAAAENEMEPDRAWRALGVAIGALIRGAPAELGGGDPKAIATEVARCMVNAISGAIDEDLVRGRTQ